MEKFSYKIPGIDFDPFLFVIFILLPVVAALLSLYSAFRLLKRARVLEDTPFSKIRSAAQGYIELNGIATSLPDVPILGELSLKPCAWYRYRIDELKTYYNQGETTSRWESILQGASTTCFLLSDGTGECIILPTGAEVITTSTLRWYGNTIPPTPYPEPSLWTFIFGTSGRFCYIEERIELNTEVYATGMFSTLQKNNEFTQVLAQQQNNIQSYMESKGSSTINILNNTGLGQKQSLLVSAHLEKKVVREYRFKAFIFFLSFLFFAIMTVTSSYSMVLKSVHQWQHSP